MTTVTRRFLLTLAILIVTVAVVALLVATRPEANMEVKQPAVTRVEVTRVEQRDIKPEVTSTGLLRPRQSASIRFEVSGELQVRHVEPGHQVEAGAPLLQLEDADYRDALTEAESQLRETRATLKRDQALLDLAKENRRLAEREYQRLEELGKGSLASVSTRESARQQLINLQGEEARLVFSLQTNRARMERQKAALSRAQRNLDRTRLLAPFKGRVNQVMVESGDYVQANTLVLELIDTSALELQAAVRPRHSPWDSDWRWMWPAAVSPANWLLCNTTPIPRPTPIRCASKFPARHCYRDSWERWGFRCVPGKTL